MKFYIYTLGCKVNTYESNVIKDKLINSGYIEGTENDSDIYIINTCTVTNMSDNKSLKMIRRVVKNYPNSISIAVGCMTQVNSSFLKNLNVSIILGNSGKSKIVEYIEKYQKDKKQIIDITNIMEAKFEDMCLNNFNKTRAFVKIEDGCENYCSYCIIPYARGKVRSKLPNVVLDEIKELVKNGHKEIVHNKNIRCSLHSTCYTCRQGLKCCRRGITINIAEDRNNQVCYSCNTHPDTDLSGS